MNQIFLELSKMLTELLPYLFLKGISLLALIVIFPKLVKYFIRFLDKVMLRRGFDDLLMSFTESFVSTLGYIILFFSAVGILGVRATSLMAVLGTAGLAVGLALQGSLSNLAGGVLILFFKQFTKGDYIAIASGQEGTVQSIRILYTTLVTVNNQVIIIPNSQLANGYIINYSTNPERRMDLTYSASYDDKVDDVIAVLTKIAESHPKVLKNKPITIRLKQHSASSLDYMFRVWTLQEDYWDTMFDFNETVRKEFDKHGIEIPYNKLDIYTK